jgi:hypothetical protein
MLLLPWGIMSLAAIPGAGGQFLAAIVYGPGNSKETSIAAVINRGEILPPLITK